jgi:hypothetical protein
MQQIARKAWLEELTALQPGLSPLIVVEQSDCFLFHDGHVTTFNGEIACTISSIAKLSGAVQASKLLQLLQKLPDEVVSIEPSEAELSISGTRRHAGVRMEANIAIDLSEVTMPADNAWRPLPDTFCTAAGLANDCTSKDDSMFIMTCAHITPNYVEGCDTHQACRATTPTGLRKPACIRRSAMQHISSLPLTRVAETKRWIHYGDANGLIISCRRYTEDYPPLEEIITTTGQPVKLPDGILSAAETAGIFAADDDKHEKIRVELHTGRLVVRGQGRHGWYKEVKRFAYTGPDMSFMITPKVLKRVLERGNDCQIPPKRLRVDAQKFIYVTSLFVDTEETTPPTEE